MPIVEKISSRQFTWLIFAVSISTSALTMPAEVIFWAKHSAWLAVLMATVAVTVGIMINLTLARRFTGQTIAQYAQTLLGKWLGKLVGIFYGLACLIICGIALRSFANVIKNGIMLATPLWAFVFGLTLLAFFAAWMGIESIARANDIVLIFSVMFIISLLLLAKPQGKLLFAMPVIQVDYVQTIKGSILPFAYLGESFFILLLAPILNKPDELKSACLKGITLSGLFLMVCIQSILYVLGSYHASADNFPLLNISQEIIILDVFERLEPLLMAFWLTVTSIKLGLFAYCFALSTSQALSLKTYRWVLVPALIALPALAMAPKSLDEFRSIWVGLLLVKILVPTAFLILPGLLLVVAKVRNAHG